MIRRPPSSPLFPSTPLFRSREGLALPLAVADNLTATRMSACSPGWGWLDLRRQRAVARTWIEALRRSEEHTSELQSQSNLVCRLLLEKKKHKSQTSCNYYTT